MIRTIVLTALLATAGTAHAAHVWNSPAADMMKPTRPGWSYDAPVTIGEPLPDGRQAAVAAPSRSAVSCGNLR